MKKVSKRIGLFISIALIAIVFAACGNTEKKTSEEQVSSGRSALTKIEGTQLTYALPSPQTDGTVSVERTMANRRSHRDFIDRPIPAEKLSQILWAAYGITQPIPNRPMLRGGLRTAPSAGALYPFEIYALVGNVSGIDPGVYKYISEEHKLVRTIAKDLREELSIEALNQRHIKDAPVTIFYSAVFSRMTGKYGERGRERYVCMDLGHSAQNIYLQTEALGLGTCAIGAFHDDKVAELLQLPEDEEPLYIMPVGYYPNQRK